MGCPGSEGSAMSQDRDTPITAAGNSNLRSIGAEADSRCGLVAARVQDVRTSDVLGQCECSPRLTRAEHRRATTAYDRAIRRRDQTVAETSVYCAIVDGS